MRENDDRRHSPAPLRGSADDAQSREYWAQHWNTFNAPRPISRRAAILGWLLIPLIVLGGVATALLFPDMR